MKLVEAQVRNFRRLEDVAIDFEPTETVLVGPNNSGKTSATDIFRLFLKTGDFSIYDFSVSKTPLFNEFGYGTSTDAHLPSIELDLWFSIDPNTEFGRAGMLLPDVEQDYNTVGIRLRYAVRDASALKAAYVLTFTPSAGRTPRKSLLEYLALPGVLHRHFEISYSALVTSSGKVNEKLLATEDGRRTLKSLLQVEFVDAQRKIDDHEHGGSTRLSALFSAYYRRNLRQATVADTTHSLIEKHNLDLTTHYAMVFTDLLDTIKGLGVPSANERSLRLISSLVPETVLQSNTTLTYFDAARSHDLPERYNGLGIKNLIYLALQICDFHLSWINTEENRPLSLIIFIEEPEAHLHAQAQQTFISNAWEIFRKASEKHGELDKVPQLVVTTHSSHILDAVEFVNVRYFRRSSSIQDANQSSGSSTSSTVTNLRRFSPRTANNISANIPQSDEQGGTNRTVNPEQSATEVLEFVKKYLKLTHCDLFFADAAILVEGTVEKLLAPVMIKKVCPGLRQRYLTILEVGGAYAHIFAELLKFLSIPYLVITDIDSVDPTRSHSACRADTPGAVTSNSAIKFFLKKTSISDLCSTTSSQHLSELRGCYVSYQKPSCVSGYSDTQPMHGRTFEETFIYENLALFRDGTLEMQEAFPISTVHNEVHQSIYELIRSPGFKKTEFALQIAMSDTCWSTPQYIADGLKWLETELKAAPVATPVEAAQ